jgi:hypothetical protein
VQYPSAVTNGDGYASCGTWTLGPAKGLNTLTASVSGITPVTFVAMAVTSSPLVSVTVTLPGEGRIWPANDGLNPGLVAASVASTYSIASVVATVQSFAAPTPVTLPLKYGKYRCDHPEGCDGWIGTPAPDVAPWGPALLFVTATDVLGNSADGAVLFTVDRTPIVTVGLPAQGALARPTVQITASCTDDDPAGCAAIEASAAIGESVEWQLLASGKATLSQSIDLSAYEGREVNLKVSGFDSNGQRTTVSRTVYVESSPRLLLRATVPGVVWDVSGSRILFLAADGAVPTLQVRDTITGVDETVEATPDLAGTWGNYGFLTSWGAIYAHGQAQPTTSPFCWLYEWREGTLANLTGLDACESLSVAGDYAIFNAGGPEKFGLYRRDLVGASDAEVSTGAGNWQNDVAANGDVVFWGIDYSVYRWRDGATSQLTNDSPDTTWNTYPLTDGSSVLYRKSTPEYRAWRIAIHDGITERILASDDRAVDPFPHRDYAIQGGWVAFTKADLQGALQVWRHGSSGEEQLTIFSGSSWIDGLAPDGTVVVRNSGKRHRAAVGSALEEIGSTLGTLVYRNGNFFLLMGPNVLEVVP